MILRFGLAGPGTEMNSARGVVSVIFDRGKVEVRLADHEGKGKGRMWEGFKAES